MIFRFARKSLKWIALLFLAFCVLMAALVGTLVLAHLQPLVLPSPTGTYKVGRAEYDWTDESRMDPLADHAGEKRELVIWVWYPAPASAQGTAAPYLPPAWVKARDADQGAGKFIESKFPTIRTHSMVDVPVAADPRAYPVLIMQPGMGPVPTDYTVFAENLASQGYVVVGINPTYTSNIIAFPDGRIALRSSRGAIPDNASAAAAANEMNTIGKVWTDDVLFVMDRLAALNGDQTSPFHGRLDLARIGVFGHSFGGASAVGVCLTDARCKAGADLDGTPMSDTLGQAIPVPFMFVAEDGCGAECDTLHQMFMGAGRDAYYLTVKGTRHFNFSDLPVRLTPLTRVLFNQLGIIGTIDPDRGLQISNAYLVAFFDRYLKGVDSRLLQGPSSAYPEVVFDKR